jgi:hypothetical protein
VGAGWQPVVVGQMSEACSSRDHEEIWLVECSGSMGVMTMALGLMKMVVQFTLSVQKKKKLPFLISKKISLIKFLQNTITIYVFK